MNIVILHRVPYAKACYDRVIDHVAHKVTYICCRDGGSDLPAGFSKHVMQGTSFDPDAIETQLGDLLRDCNRLVARSEYDLIAASVLRERFRIPGDKPNDVRPMRDKLLMRQMCESACVAQPQFWTPDEFLTAIPGAGRYLLKPRLEASSYGITTGTANDVAAVLGQLTEAEAYLVEAFIEGRILHVDGFVTHGELQAVVTSEYVGNCLAYASGAPLGSVQVPHDESAVMLTRRTLSALAHENGSFHLEIIVDEQGRYHFLEVASRVGGAGVADTFEMKTGVNLYHADLYHQVFNESLRRESPESPEFFGWFVYPGHGCEERLLCEFDAEKWRPNLASYHLNPAAKKVSGAISYAPDASPLSGVVRGRPGELKGVIERIFRETATSQHAS